MLYTSHLTEDKKIYFTKEKSMGKTECTSLKKELFLIQKHLKIMSWSRRVNINILNFPDLE